MADSIQRGIRSAQIGMLINSALAATKLVAGIVGNTYALVADAIESATDIFSSLIVWRGLHMAARDADDDYPFGYGKAESLATGLVALMLLAAALGIAVQSVREIRTPHLTPAPWTLGVLVAVMAVKWTLSRRVHAVGAEIGSTAVKADAWHHMSDAITSAAAFVGIGIAVLGSRYLGGSGWASADDWAALVASAVIAFNGVSMLRPAVHDLMDRTPGADVVASVRRAAEAVPGVLATEKIAVRRSGLVYRVTLHVQADEQMTLHDAHELSGRVKGAIRAAVPQVGAVLVHMEPFVPPHDAAR
ncbi:cation diffusion facilitator family transporter [Longimicrobium sp.]|uniref:cation diffusion facilitator family transporter n=1 Tax=Longimicrobium sp. TaxID=2029185 RepID=UPI002E2EDEB7|nr:cation diffusion facilitator family transporter [Longimicrobium sp.]HEX6036891.1 cation diffusion facilitator family transporter [Longimicrobium sp.]